MQDNASQKSSIATTAIALIVILLLAYFAIYKLVTKHVPAWQPYPHADTVSLAQGTAISAGEYRGSNADKTGRFVVFAKTGKDPFLTIRLHKSAALLVKTVVDYPNRNTCNDTSKDLAHLTVISPYV